VSRLVTLAALCAALLPATVSPGQVKLTGVNLAGAEFGHHVALPGEHGKHYSYPTPAEVDYFVARGMNTFRLPFAWERLQRSPGADFDATEFGRLDAVVTYATGKGASVVLDPHNYARYQGKVIGTAGAVTNADFADFWAKLATHYKGNDKVIFGLMNEPNAVPSTEHWVATANAAIAAIRKAGAKNMILVPGNAWSGAHSWTGNWYGTPNAVAMLKVVDPAENYAFDMHQYLDPDSSGTKEGVVSPTIGVERLKKATAWLKEHKRKAFLGEFAVANAKVGDAPGQIGDEAITQMLDYMDANSDVWIGWAWWAAGPRWGDYMFTIEPRKIGTPEQSDRPAMTLLARRLKPATAPAASAAAATPATSAAAAAPATDRAGVRIILAGDSTVTDTGGWGRGFAACVDDAAAVEVINLARSGRSLRSFVAEGSWKKCLDLKPDYVLIQFGHNDQKLDDPAVGPGPGSGYRQFLTRYIDEARAAGIRPVLVTSLSRRQWGPDGRIRSTLVPYVEVVKAIAAEKNVPLVDLHARSIELYEKLGKDGVLALSPLLAPTTRPAPAPAATRRAYDATHLNAHGSQVIGPLVAGDLKTAVPDLAPHLKPAN